MTIANLGSGSLVTGTTASITPSDIAGSASDILTVLVAQNIPAANLGSVTHSLSANGTGWTKLDEEDIAVRTDATSIAGHTSLWTARRGETNGNMPTITSNVTGTGIYTKLYAMTDDDPTAAGVQFWEGLTTSPRAAGVASNSAAITLGGNNRMLTAFHAVTDNEAVGTPAAPWSNWGTSGSATGDDFTLCAERASGQSAGTSITSSRTKAATDPSVVFTIAFFSAADAPPPPGGDVTGTLAATETSTDDPTGSGTVTWPIHANSGNGTETLVGINLDLWKLELPVDADGNTDGGIDGVTVNPIPAGYEYVPYFDTLTTGELYFLTPTVGCRIGSTSYPRSELRELNDDGTLAAWTIDDGSLHELTGTFRIEHSAIQSSDGTPGRIVFMQIHGPADELVRMTYKAGKVFYRNDKEETSPGVFAEVQHDLVDGLGNITSIPEGADFQSRVRIQSGSIYCEVTHAGTTYSATSPIGGFWPGLALNFKAGNYCLTGHPSGTAGTKGTEYSAVAISALSDPQHGDATTGSGAISEGSNDTAAGSGTVAVSGSGAGTEAGADDPTGSGAVGISGTGGATETSTDDPTGAGTIAVSGTGTLTETQTDDPTGAGTVTVSGSGAAIETGQDSAAGSATVRVAGSLGATEQGGDAVAGSGSVSNPGSVAGSLAAMEAASDTLAGVGTVSVAGALGGGETQPDTPQGVGSVGVAGGMAAAEAGPDSFSGTATLQQPTAGTLAAAEPVNDATAAAGQVDISGSLSAVEAQADTFSGSLVDEAIRFRTVYRGFGQRPAVSRMNRQPFYVRRT